MHELPYFPNFIHSFSKETNIYILQDLSKNLGWIELNLHPLGILGTIQRLNVCPNICKTTSPLHPGALSAHLLSPTARVALATPSMYHLPVPQPMKVAVMNRCAMHQPRPTSACCSSFVTAPVLAFLPLSHPVPFLPVPTGLTSQISHIQGSLSLKSRLVGQAKVSLSTGPCL